MGINEISKRRNTARTAEQNKISKIQRNRKPNTEIRDRGGYKRQTSSNQRTSMSNMQREMGK